MRLYYPDDAKSPELTSLLTKRAPHFIWNGVFLILILSVCLVFSLNYISSPETLKGTAVITKCDDESRNRNLLAHLKVNNAALSVREFTEAKAKVQIEGGSYALQIKSVQLKGDSATLLVELLEPFPYSLIEKHEYSSKLVVSSRTLYDRLLSNLTASIRRL